MRDIDSGSQRVSDTLIASDKDSDAELRAVVGGGDAYAGGELHTRHIA